MKRDISEFVPRCLVCQQVKDEHQVPSGLLQLVMIPEWKWDRVMMDFVVVDRLTKSAHFISVRIDYSLDKLAELYISEIVRLHRVLVLIISDRDPKFTSQFWKKLQEALGTRLNFSKTFHPQTNGQSERIIQIVEDMFRCYVLEFEGNWKKYLSLVEFVYNNSSQSSIKMAPYEALYSYKCRTPLYWTKLSEKKIHGKLYADLKRKDIEFQIGDSVYLKVSPWKKILRFGRKGKLSPRFIGPYEIVLALFSELEKIHHVFHVSILDPSHVISLTEIEIQPDMTTEQNLARKVKELKNKGIALVKVLCQCHRVEEATWEPDEAMRKQYPNLFSGKIFRTEIPKGESCNNPFLVKSE
ncbi:reverse transcriptase [Gossypium australe]|uniref:Reverse transcriptase n=1 Tax=Gossypium australe TaxID=47621 RepID=A0A5B6VA10_9ROSI|nr:reverse transcriptase [Gossypium australe]